MDQLLRFSILLFSLPVSAWSMEKGESCFVSQPNKEVWRKTGQSVVLPCTKSSHCSIKDVRYEWFSFSGNSAHRLNLQSNLLKYSLEGASLHIKSLHANDSGIYHCALHGEPGKGHQHVGMGTTLVVREKVHVMVRNVLLWLSFVLLAIYNLALVTLIIKKYGCSMGVCRKMNKTYKNNSTKKRQFHDVLQEITSRNNLERSKQAADLTGSTDDIYQNV
ncbi:immunoglobulin superfamily member 6 [Cheilinus undulatus]|uniref:immunoglobulin superfamily member 6 n=1 Tax=Cheilinus undulatus TaxID=241271 RepID=UPI001BD50CD5|nr:immunoglobulin superfamily member 6 [Cheilinus undulatus]